VNDAALLRHNLWPAVLVFPATCETQWFSLGNGSALSSIFAKKKNLHGQNHHMGNFSDSTSSHLPSLTYNMFTEKKPQPAP
jgi:hypothetical protein